LSRGLLRQAEQPGDFIPGKNNIALAGSLAHSKSEFYLLVEIEVWWYASLFPAGISFVNRLRWARRIVGQEESEPIAEQQKRHQTYRSG